MLRDFNGQKKKKDFFFFSSVVRKYIGIKFILTSEKG